MYKQKLIISFFVFLALFYFLIDAVSNSLNIQHFIATKENLKNEEVNTMPPDIMTSFVFLEIVDQTLCDESKGCVPTAISSSGSGSHISDTEILTAGHICLKLEALNEERNKINTLENFILLGTSGYYSRLEMVVKKIDIVNDLCIVETTRPTFAVPLSIRNHELKRGEKVYTSSAPNQFYERGNLLITYSGYFSGNSTSELLPNVSVFTLPSSPGSSGSPILSPEGDIVSIICLSVIDTENITLGPRLEAIHKFLRDD